MSEYKIAEASGRTGAAHTLRAEINLGLKKVTMGFFRRRRK